MGDGDTDGDADADVDVDDAEDAAVVAGAVDVGEVEVEVKEAERCDAGDAEAKEAERCGVGDGEAVSGDFGRTELDDEARLSSGKESLAHRPILAKSKADVWESHGRLTSAFLKTSVMLSLLVSQDMRSR